MKSKEFVFLSITTKHQIMNRLKSFKYILLVLGLYSFVVACNENSFITEVDIDTPGHEPKLTVSARFIKNDPYDDKQYIYVTASKAINDQKEIQTVKGAEVSLWEGDKKIDTGIYIDSIPQTYLYNKKLSGYLLSFSDFKANTEYTLKVSADGFEPVKSTVRMPEKSVVSDARFIEDSFNAPDDPGTTLDEIVMNIPNLNEEKFYLVEVEKVTIFRNGTRTDTSISRLYLTPESPLFYEYNNGSANSILFRGKDVVQFKNDIKVGFRGNTINPTRSTYFIVHFYDITKDQYSFLVSYDQYRHLGENPFAEPVVVYSNVKNGLGIFSLEQHQAIKVEP